ncbi:MAG: GlmU family protein [Saprospiraceae bacterium]
MNIILFDDAPIRKNLLPLTFTRPVAELRVGILTITQKWEKWLNGTVSYITEDYLAGKYAIEVADVNVVINASVLPSERLVALVEQLEMNEALLQGDELIAAKLNEKQFERLMEDEEIDELQGFDVEDTPFNRIKHPYDIFLCNGEEIAIDFQLITKGRASQSLSPSNQIANPAHIFIEEGARVECAMLNANAGPIYIGKNAEVMEGSLIRGPFALGENSKVKMGSKIYGKTTIGPWSKVGGEINNSVIIGHSNKGHDGYLGNAVLGEWCNLGAGTNNSNLKNNYAEVKLWNYAAERFLPTGQQFCGLIMGDHSKVGIGVTFNTGTVVGVSCNIFGAGFPRNFIPSFSWGGAAGFKTYRNDKAMDTAERVMQRRGKPLEVAERVILIRISEDTAKFRRWEQK